MPDVPSNKDYSLIGILEVEDKKEEIISLLEECIKKLPEEYQLIIKSRFYEGKTFEEMGKDLKISYGRAEQIHKLALKKLFYLAKQSGLYDLYIE